MKKKNLILKFTDSGKEFLFEDKVFVIQDKKLVENLEKTNIKNYESNLVIKSLNDTPIYDVVQVKINVSETGHFLVNFAKDSLSEENRKSLLEEIGKLKSDAALTNSSQLKKAKRLVSILNKYSPLFAVYIAEGNYKIDTGKLALETFKFPLLVLKKQEKKFKIGGRSSKSGENKYSSFSVLAPDYFFVLLFALLCAFGAFTALFEFKNEQNIWIFLTILAVAFAFVLILAVQSTCYKKGKLINPFLRYYLIIFIALGVVGGIAGGYYLSKLVLKTEIADFDYKHLMILTCIISGPVCLSALTTSRLANLVVKRKYEKKN